MHIINPPVSDNTEHYDMGYPPDLKPEPVASFWTVAIYLEELAYGGPEEGGWWYTRGERIDVPLGEGFNPNDVLTVFHGEGAEQEAYAYANTLNDQLEATVNAGRREISSVLSNGRYYARAHEGYPPAGFPDQRPHYE